MLAPDDSRWVHRDEDLRVPTQAWVHRARYVGPSGGKPAEVAQAKDGIDRALILARLQARRLIVPDENATWTLTAIPAAIRLVREHGIDAVITTSPPGSTHFVGAAVQRATGARWVADLRDSLVAHAHRRADTMATRAKAAMHRRVARLVASRADADHLRVGGDLAGGAASSNRVGGSSRSPTAATSTTSPVSSTGRRRASGSRMPAASSASVTRDRSSRRCTTPGSTSGRASSATFVPATVSGPRRSQLGDRLELIPYAPRQRSLELQRDSEALLLLIPEAGGRGKGVLSGKVFEYLAARRPILAAVPPDGAAAELIVATGAGLVVAARRPGCAACRAPDLHARFANGGLPDVDLAESWERKLSRRARVEDVADVLRSLA